MPSEPTPAMPVTPARAQDRAAIEDLLRGAALPVEGLADHLGSALVARGHDGVVGCAALEVYGEDALLRSVVALPSCRGRGVGAALVCAALELAERCGVRRVWLLTTTAEGYFPRLGFRRAERDVAPPVLSQSAEFRGACPASAVLMRRG